jgi:predicted HicB family RNase H-like nuclease
MIGSVPQLVLEQVNIQEKAKQETLKKKGEEQRQEYRKEMREMLVEMMDELTGVVAKRVVGELFGCEELMRVEE